MTPSLRLASLLAFLAAGASARDWTGYIVDARCFESEEHNANPTDTESYVDRNLGIEIRICHPTSKTKSFVFIEQNGLRYSVDDAGTARIADFVRANGKKAGDLVSVDGTKSPPYRLQLKKISLAP